MNNKRNWKTISKRSSIWHTVSNRLPLIATCIAALSSVAAFGLNYYMVEKVRNDLSKQTLALNQQTVELDKVKTELAKDAQRTADLNALTNQAQLALMVQQTISNQKNQNIKNKVDERTTRVDEARLTPDFAKLTNDLRPALNVACTTTRESLALVLVACTFKNTGAFKLALKLDNVTAWDYRSDATLNGKIKRHFGSDSNNVPANGSANNNFYVELSDGVRDFTARLSITATTDRQAIAMTKKLSLGILNDEDLKELSTQGYLVNLKIPMY